MTPRYLDVAACAAYIGRTPTAVRRLADRQQIPVIVIGRKRQFDIQKIDRWMEAHSRRGARL